MQGDPTDDQRLRFYFALSTPHVCISQVLSTKAAEDEKPTNQFVQEHLIRSHLNNLPLEQL